MNKPDSSTRMATPTPVEEARMTLLGHDLRAAVSDIIGGLRLIDHSAFDDGTRLQLERIRASGEVLARLLEEGLSMMLGGDDFGVAHPANVQMSRFLYDVQMRWSGRASEKGIDFHTYVAPDVPQVLTLDRVALERILSNIISNAVKYTDAGAVRLNITLAASGRLCFVVTDQGPGFSADALARLFEYEGRPNGTVKPGNGLGMHISKSMSGRLGGTISVENLQAGGARVTLELPSDIWAAAAPEAAPDLPDLSRVKVLVAEDNPTNQKIIGLMLGKMGAEYEIASDGVEALQWLGREAFDLALIDIEMPRLSGIEVIRALRASSSAHRGMPIIAVTAYVLRANRDAIYAAGADAILAKPLAGLDAFGMAIGNVLHRADDLALPAPAISEAAEIDRACFDRLMHIAGPEAGRELLDRLCTDLRNTERGLITALAASDCDGVRSETHVLIALAGAVGAIGLQSVAQGLNTVAHRRDTSQLSALGQTALALLDRLIHFVMREKVTRGELA